MVVIGGNQEMEDMESMEETVGVLIFMLPFSTLDTVEKVSHRKQQMEDRVHIWVLGEESEESW